MRDPRWEGRLFRSIVVLTFALASIGAHGAAATTSSCASFDQTTLCLGTPAAVLTGFVPITLTKDPNGGPITVTWTPTGGREMDVITRFAPDPGPREYSFVWPTHKYLDSTGVLTARLEQLGSSVDLELTLSNGNLTDTHHEPDDWRSFLPEPWTGATPPLVAAVGDGPDGRSPAAAVAQSIVDADPALLLYLGDIYQDGTPAELWNHFGDPSFDGGPGSLWGQLADRTQPTLGDHEVENLSAWMDYFRGRPRFNSFRFGGVLFLNLNSTASFDTGSKQLEFAAARLENAPACVVAFWHTPAISGGQVLGAGPMWELLATNGADLVLSGNKHSMAEYRPLTEDFQLEGHMVQLIAGSGGHQLGTALTDPEGRVAWSLGETAGAAYLTLNGAEDGGKAHSIGWTFRDVSGSALRSGSVDCGSSDPPPPPPPPPELVVLDGFSRIVGTGWGSADIGGPWSVVGGSPSAFSVSGSEGRIECGPRDEQTVVLTQSTATRDLTALLTIRQGSLPSGPEKPDTAVLLRWRPKSHIRVGYLVRPSGAIHLRAESSPGGRLFWDVASGLVVQKGDVFKLRVEVTGVEPTTVRARAWMADAPEPSGWQAVATSVVAELQTAGRVGISLSVDGNRSSVANIEHLEVIGA